MSARAVELYDLLATPLTTSRAAKEISIDVFITDYDGNPANLDVDALGIFNIFYPEPPDYPKPPFINEGGGFPGEILARNSLYSFLLKKFNNQIKNIMIV